MPQKGNTKMTCGWGTNPCPERKCIHLTEIRLESFVLWARFEERNLPKIEGCGQTWTCVTSPYAPVPCSITSSTGTSSPCMTQP